MWLTPVYRLHAYPRHVNVERGPASRRYASCSRPRQTMLKRCSTIRFLVGRHRQKATAGHLPNFNWLRLVRGWKRLLPASLMISHPLGISATLFDAIRSRVVPIA